MAETITTGRSSICAATIPATLSKARASDPDVPPNFITLGAPKGIPNQPLDAGFSLSLQTKRGRSRMNTTDLINRIAIRTRVDSFPARAQTVFVVALHLYSVTVPRI